RVGGRGGGGGRGRDGSVRRREHQAGRGVATEEVVDDRAEVQPALAAGGVRQREALVRQRERAGAVVVGPGEVDGHRADAAAAADEEGAVGRAHLDADADRHAQGGVAAGRIDVAGGRALLRQGRRHGGRQGIGDVRRDDREDELALEVAGGGRSEERRGG